MSSVRVNEILDFGLENERFAMDVGITLGEGRKRRHGESAVRSGSYLLQWVAFSRDERSKRKRLKSKYLNV
jgi:hypothetical protein